MSSNSFFTSGASGYGYNINVDSLRFKNINSGFVYVGSTGLADVKQVQTEELGDSTITSSKIASNINLTGIPTVDTASSGTNTTQIASTAFVQSAITNLVDSAPSALNTLNELANALGADANFSTTVTNSISGKVSKTGNEEISGVKTFTVLPESSSGPTAANQFANKSYVDTQIQNITLSQGATGAQGATGTAGTNGIAGSQGATGAQGAAGSSSGSTGIAIDNDNTNTTMYPVFTGGTGLLRDLNIDITTGPLTYNPSTGNLTTAKINNVIVGSTGSDVYLGDNTNTLEIQGGFRWNIGGTITGTTTLTSPLAQFYTLGGVVSADYTVTLPTPSSTINGTYVVFKKIAKTGDITFTTSSSTSIFYDDSVFTSSSSVIMKGDTKTADYNSSFICDSTNWYKLLTK